VKGHLLGENIFVISHFLTRRECNQLIDRAEKQGFNKSPPSGGGHGRTGREEGRNNSFTILNDPMLSDELFDRVRPFLPSSLDFMSDSPYLSDFDRDKKEQNEWRAIGIVDRLRVYRYEKNETYPEHMDGSYRRQVTMASGAVYVQQSYLSLLCYLNEGFVGGETEFYPTKRHCRFLNHRYRDSDRDRIEVVRVQPKSGLALVNVHHILHQGNRVLAGHVPKYVLRTDILFQKKLRSTLTTHLKQPQPPQPPQPQPQQEQQQRKASRKTKTNKKSNSSKRTKQDQGSREQDHPVLVGKWVHLFEPSCKDYHD